MVSRTDVRYENEGKPVADANVSRKNPTFQSLNSSHDWRMFELPNIPLDVDNKWFENHLVCNRAIHCIRMKCINTDYFVNVPLLQIYAKKKKCSLHIALKENKNDRKKGKTTRNSRFNREKEKKTQYVWDNYRFHGKCVIRANTQQLVCRHFSII